MALNVLHILDHSVPLHSGYTFRTLAILREQRKLGWSTHHLTSPKQGATDQACEDVDGMLFHRTPAAANGTRWPPGIGEMVLMRRLEKRIEDVARSVKADLIHAHSPVLNALPAMRVAERLRIPAVYEVRAFWEDAAVDHGTTTGNSLRYRMTRGLETMALKRADHVFTICEGLRCDILGRGIPQGKVTVIPNAVDIESFEMGGRADEALKASLGLAGATVVGFVGSFYAYEGLDLLLQSLPALLARQPAVRVLLVGGGPQADALKAQAASMGLADKVVFAGRVPHAQVSRYYDLIDVLAYPRHSMRLTELVTPLKPLEAMAQGRLFVASDVGGHQELVRDGETGVLFRAGSADALAQALDKLLTQHELWPGLRQAGRRFVETERHWARSVSNYRPVYERLVRATAMA